MNESTKQREREREREKEICIRHCYRDHKTRKSNIAYQHPSPVHMIVMRYVNTVSTKKGGSGKYLLPLQKIDAHYTTTPQNGGGGDCNDPNNDGSRI
jgi:hypothetical protein